MTGGREVLLATIFPECRHATSLAPCAREVKHESFRDRYGQALELLFLKKLREEMKFATAQMLSAQIADDIKQTQNVPVP